ncbi:MAG: hypothetical protein ABL977_11320 [Candidatus Eisenbacteria bacterium]
MMKSSNGRSTTRGPAVRLRASALREFAQRPRVVAAVPVWNLAPCTRVRPATGCCTTDTPFAPGHTRKPLRCNNGSAARAVQ